MAGDSARLKNSLKEFERELFNQKKILSQTKPLKNSLENALNAFENAEDLINENNQKTFKNEVKEKNLLSLFLEVKRQLSGLNNALSEKSHRLELIKEKLEKTRNYRYYRSLKTEKAWAFLEKIIGHYSLDWIVFQPEIIGIVNSSWTEQPFAKKKGEGVEMDASKLREFTKILEKNGIKSGFYFECSQFRLFWKKSNLLLAKASHKTIQQLDSLAVLCDIKPLEK